MTNKHLIQIVMYEADLRIFKTVQYYVISYSSTFDDCKKFHQVDTNNYIKLL